MTEVVKKLAFYKKLRAYFEFQIVEGTPGCLQWDRGTLIFKGEYERCFIILLNSRKYIMKTQTI